MTGPSQFQDLTTDDISPNELKKLRRAISFGLWLEPQPTNRIQPTTDTDVTQSAGRMTISPRKEIQIGPIVTPSV